VGAVVIFVNNYLSGSYEYVTENLVDTGYTVVGDFIKNQKGMIL